MIVDKMVYGRLWHIVRLCMRMRILCDDVNVCALRVLCAVGVCVCARHGIHVHIYYMACEYIKHIYTSHTDTHLSIETLTAKV